MVCNYIFLGWEQATLCNVRGGFLGFFLGNFFNSRYFKREVLLIPQQQQRARAAKPKGGKEERNNGDHFQRDAWRERAHPGEHPLEGRIPGVK